MKKQFIAAVFTVAIMLSARAEEGMWLPYLLGQKVYNDMVAKGLKLTKEQLYSINNVSMKDAIVIFGNGCTGEIVSGEGLIFTNHHCGYSAIAEASNVENNYLRDGFWATDKKKEIPAKSLSVQFLRTVTDVTKEVEDALVGLAGIERTKAMAKAFASIEKKAVEGTSHEACMSPMYKANQFLLFIYEKYNDVRLVGTAPESIGKFGGDTDNWYWPRHTGDFAVFRVYTSKDGKAAKYAADNIPMKPKWFLPISIKGVKENDYAMVLGYPGGTNRYETSYGIKLSTDINNPSLVALRDVRLKHMLTEMKKDPAVKLQLASRYAGAANYWKFFEGETKQLKKHHIYEDKVKAEAAFIEWAKNNPEYKNVFPQYEEVYNKWVPYAKQRVYLREGILGTTLVAFANQLAAFENVSTPGAADIAAITKKMDASRNTFLKEFNKPSEQNIVADVTKMFYTDIDKAQQPEEFYTHLKNNYGSLNEDDTYKKFAANMFANTIILDDAKWKNFITNPDVKILQNDPACVYARTFTKHYSTKYNPYYDAFSAKNEDLGRLYLKGVMQMNKTANRYPDANFTMRLSYGKVKGYNPRDAVKYDYVTTMTGLMEKYVQGDYEFNLPDKLITMYNKKDFGRYIDPARKDVVVAFITTNDITGGNSGSPVINGKGELIGLAFDGNYESLGNKMAFNENMNRTICVDVRYVLWCIEKLGGATNIINELKIMK